MLHGGRTAGAATRSASQVARVSLSDVARRCGLTASTGNGNGSALTIEKQSATMVFAPDSRKMTFDGALIWLNAPVTMERDLWMVARADAEGIIYPLLETTSAPQRAREATIVLDPGHGGADTGAVGRRKVAEKTIVLDIARRTRQRLDAANTRARLTREHDFTLDLAERTALAREWRADVFVSIHLNSAGNGEAAGAETYALTAPGFQSTSGQKCDKNSYHGNNHDGANTLLAYFVHKEILARTKNDDRGVRRARFDVLRDAPCSAILVECGFLSNKIEEKKLLDDNYRDRIAEGIAKGITTYLRGDSPDR